MANIKPFPALRPSPELASQICELPYDVFTTQEARIRAEGNALSFLRVSKPEIDLPEDLPPGDQRIYQKGRENFLSLVRQQALKTDPQPCFYLYRQKLGTHSQTGLVAVASCDDYRAAIIRKHETTHPDKEEDRARHIESLDAQTGPVFLLYPANANLNDIISIQTEEVPEIDFASSDGIQHSTWMISDPALIRCVQIAFSRIQTLYIADGHHRCAAASTVSNRLNGRGYSNYFLCALFPHDQVQIMAYHRVVKDLNGFSPAELIQRLNSVFLLRAQGDSEPSHVHEVCLYLDHQWYALDFRNELYASEDLVDQLDASLLQNLVLAPMFDIDDPRTNPRLGFVGGVRGTGELQRLVDSGQYACAFSLYPTQVEQLITVSNAGKLMPPKSTWFEPKLLDGLFSHLLSESIG